jgi:hypothetical protein
VILKFVQVNESSSSFVVGRQRMERAGKEMCLIWEAHSVFEMKERVVVVG